MRQAILDANTTFGGVGYPEEPNLNRAIAVLTNAETVSYVTFLNVYVFKDEAGSWCGWHC